MNQKIKEVIIPPLAGSLIALLFGIALQTLLVEWYYPQDFDEVFSQYFFVDIYFMAFFPILIVAILFQLLVASKIWKRYAQNKKVLNLTLPQLVISFCLISAIGVTLYNWQTFQGYNILLELFVRTTVILIVYWASNLYTLKFIGRK